MRILLLLFLCALHPLRAQNLSESREGTEKDWFTQSREQIRLNEKDSLYKANLSLFRQGHQKGYFYFLHPALPQFEPYLDFPEFEKLVEEDRLLYEAAMETSLTRYQVKLPNRIDVSENYPNTWNSPRRRRRQTCDEPQRVGRPTAEGPNRSQYDVIRSP